MRVYEDDAQVEVPNGCYPGTLKKFRDYTTKGGKDMVLIDFKLDDDDGNESDTTVTYWGWPSHRNIRECFDPQKINEAMEDKRYDWDQLLDGKFIVTVENTVGEKGTFCKAISAVPSGYGGPSLLDAASELGAEPVGSSGLAPVAQDGEVSYGDPFSDN